MNAKNPDSGFLEPQVSPDPRGEFRHKPIWDRGDPIDAELMQFTVGDGRGSAGISTVIVLFVLLKIGKEQNAWDQLE